MNRRQGFGLAAGLAVALAGGIALAQSNVPIYSTPNGTGLVVGAGGTLTVKPGGSLVADPGSTVTGVSPGGSDPCLTPVAVVLDSGSRNLLPFFVSQRAWKVVGVRAVVATAAGDVTTLAVLKAPSGTNSTSGTALTTGTFDLNSASATTVTGTLSATASDLLLATGDRLLLNLGGTGVIGSTLGAVTVCLQPQ